MLEQVSDTGSTGYLFDQPVVRNPAGEELRLDELLGSGFAVVLKQAEAEELTLSDHSRAILETIGARIISLNNLEPVRGRFGRLFERHEAVIARHRRRKKKDKRKKFAPDVCLAFVLSVLLTSCADGSSGVGDNSPLTPTQASKRPNVLVIIVDDVGFNDLSIFGSEIATPNIDALAAEGLLLTNFHVASMCSPTRAMLMSGTDSHIAGLGNMGEVLAPNQKGQPGYEGYLNFRVAAMPELFKEAGYNTYMTGKWHLGVTEETSPAARGFDKSFALAEGGAGAFSNKLPLFGPKDAIYREDGKLVEELPDGFYSTKFYTERMIEYIESGREDGNPFFAYYAHTSPHWPLQAPQESIAKYLGVYDSGYDVLREKRLAALKELGLVDPDLEAFPRLGGEQAWDEFSQEEQRYQSKVMAIYAAMLDDLDVYTGQLIDYLKSIGEYDNTLIFFTSDNGPEGHNLTAGAKDLRKWIDECCDNSYENIGNPDSYVWYGPNWAQVGNVPLRMFKGYTSQGGVRAPAFFHFPKDYAGGRMTNAETTIKDVLATLLDISGITHPGAGEFQGREVVTMQGRSIVPLLEGSIRTIREPQDYMGWELFGKRAIRQGNWKIIYLPPPKVHEYVVPVAEAGRWQLYNLQDDPQEVTDLAEQYPEKLTEMIDLWEEYAARGGLILPNESSGY